MRCEEEGVITANPAEIELRTARRALALLKSRLGGEGMLNLLAPLLDESDEVVRDWTRQGGGEPYGEAVVRFEVEGLSCEEFLQWFEVGFADVDGVALPGHPEHYLLGWQEEPTATSGGLYREVETFGGRPVAALLEFFDDPDESPIPARPGFPYRQHGKAFLRDRTEFAHVHNQFRNTDRGFEAVIAVYFVAGVPDEVVAGHREHIAVEWTNWLTMGCEASAAEPAERNEVKG